MRLHIRAVRLRAHTLDGIFGRTVAFEPGFNVLRGGNSRGKTQVVQAIIYALGLERMLLARTNTPLGSALTSEVRIADDDKAPGLNVKRSWLAIEIENSAGHIITAQRHVRHEYLQPNLIRVWNGPALTNPSFTGVAEDYFLHSPGSASRDLGFHKLLTDILDWSMPEVATYTGTSTKLYPDVVFPFIIVDQQSWGSAGPRKVERYQIREPIRRSAEFLLRLAGPMAETRRAQLELSMADLRTSWEAERSAVETLAGTVGGRIVGVPRHAAGAQGRNAAPEPTDLDNAELQILDDGEWARADIILTRLSKQLQEARMAGERRIASGVDQRTQYQLNEARSELADLVAAARLVEQDLSLSEAQLSALDRRLSLLQDERNRNTDIRTLVRLGSQVSASHLADHNCPTCRQSLDAVEADDLGPVLDVDETVSLLNSQISTTHKMWDRAQSVVSQASNTYIAMQRRIDQLRTTVRAFEADTMAPVKSLSTGEIAKTVTLQLRHDELLRTQAALDERMEQLAGLAEQIAVVRVELSSLPRGIPEEDTARLVEVTSLMQQKLISTRFGSYSAEEVVLDQDSLRPTRAGFDLDIDVSASDVVRTKVAYLDAIRAIGQSSGRHPGLLILDEPRQQDIDPVDFAVMLQYLASSTDVIGQTIITSATPREELDRLVSGIPVNIIDIGDARLIQPVGNKDPLDFN